MNSPPASQSSQDGEPSNLDIKIEDDAPLSKQRKVKPPAIVSAKIWMVVCGGATFVLLLLLLIPERDSQARSIARQYMATEYEFQVVEEIGWTELERATDDRFKGHPTMMQFILSFKTDYWGSETFMKKIFYYDPEANTIECVGASRRDCDSMQVVSP